MKWTEFLLVGWIPVEKGRESGSVQAQQHGRELEVCIPPPGQSQELILVVDDDPDILDALSEILEAEGYAVARARNGQEALEAVAQPRRPQLILLDLMMPVMDGWEFARRLRQLPSDLARTPIIVLSADRNVTAKAQEIGAAGHLAKPFELPELLDLVQRTLGPKD